jgi:hypothetical protein
MASLIAIILAMKKRSAPIQYEKQYESEEARCLSIKAMPSEHVSANVNDPSMDN